MSPPLSFPSPAELVRICDQLVGKTSLDVLSRFASIAPSLWPPPSIAAVGSDAASAADSGDDDELEFNDEFDDEFNDEFNDDDLVHLHPMTIGHELARAILIRHFSELKLDKLLKWVEKPLSASETDHVRARAVGIALQHLMHEVRGVRLEKSVAADEALLEKQRVAEWGNADRVLAAARVASAFRGARSASYVQGGGVPLTTTNIEFLTRYELLVDDGAVFSAGIGYSEFAHAAGPTSELARQYLIDTGCIEMLSKVAAAPSGITRDVLHRQWREYAMPLWKDGHRSYITDSAFPRLTALYDFGLIEGEVIFRVTVRGHAVLAACGVTVNESKIPRGVFVVGETGSTHTIYHRVIDMHSERTGKLFERLVVELYRHQGWSVKHKAPSGGSDGGMDLLCTRIVEPSTEVTLAVEVKVIKNVGRPVIQKLSGAMVPSHISNGTVVTSGQFSVPAREEAKSSPQKLTLIDRDDLVALMVKTRFAQVEDREKTYVDVRHV